MNYYHANEIIDRLWIGDVKSSEDKDFLKNEKIDVIVNCTKDLPNHFEPFSYREIPNDVVENYFIKYFRVPCDDNGKESEIDNFYRETHKVIDDVQKLYNSNKRLLIHCMAGQQRSCSFALCLMSRIGISKSSAFLTIVQKRQSAFNFGLEVHFKRAIDEFI